MARRPPGVRQRRGRSSASHRTMATEYEQTDRPRVYRKSGRGSYDRELVHSILDEALTCHVGFVQDEQPFVIPTIHARVGETLFLHGAKGNRMLKALTDGTPCCVTVTLVDELVLARAALHHSLNYRSVMVSAFPAKAPTRGGKERPRAPAAGNMPRARPTGAREPDPPALRTT